jgi:hypothetical protein
MHGETMKLEKCVCILFSLEKRGRRKDRNVVGLLELQVSVTVVLVHTAAQHITKSKQALQ